MGEIGEAKVPSVTERWLLEQNESTNVSSEKIITEKPTETPTVEETLEIPAAEKTDEIPSVEEGTDNISSDQHTEENPTVEEGTVTPDDDTPVEPEVEEKPEIKIETAPADFRFPTTNQTRHCFTRYIEYHRCIQAKGEEAEECNKYAKYYRSLCPNEWIERWNEQREEGTFPGPL